MFALLVQPWSSVPTLALFWGDAIQKTGSSVLVQNRSMGWMLNSTTAEVVGHHPKALTVFRCVLFECFPFDPQNLVAGLQQSGVKKFKFPYTHKNNMSDVK